MLVVSAAIKGDFCGLLQTLCWTAKAAIFILNLMRGTCMYNGSNCALAMLQFLSHPPHIEIHVAVKQNCYSVCHHLHAYLPSQKKNRLDTIFSCIRQFCAFSSACCLDSCSPMFCVVTERVMARSTSSLWHLPLWCFWNAAVAFFQLQNPLMIYNILHVQWTIIKINYNSSVTYNGWFHIFLSHFILPKCSYMCMTEYHTICFVVMQKAVLLEPRSLTRTHRFFKWVLRERKRSAGWWGLTQVEKLLSHIM